MKKVRMILGLTLGLLLFVPLLASANGTPPTTVPEPGILILLGIGLSAVGVFSRCIKF